MCRSRHSLILCNITSLKTRLLPIENRFENSFGGFISGLACMIGM